MRKYIALLLRENFYLIYPDFRLKGGIESFESTFQYYKNDLEEVPNERMETAIELYRGYSELLANNNLNDL